MSNGQRVPFQERPRAHGPFFVSNVPRGAKIKTSIEEGDEVILRMGDESVLVRDIRRTSTSDYTGTVYGFEPSHQLECEGLRVEDTVDFEERHIFSCSTA